MELPSHPETDDSADRPPGSAAATWATRLVIAVIVALVAAMVLLHLTGVVGPGSN